MRLSLFRLFKSDPSSSDVLGDMARYLSVELSKNFQELLLGLRSLSLEDNFDGWIEENLTINASSEAKIRNRLGPIVPKHRVILRSTSASIADGTTAWSKDFVYLRNTGASAATVTVLFLK
jgi:hypothetical protein